MNTLQTEQPGSGAVRTKPANGKGLPKISGALTLRLPSAAIVGDTLYLVGFWMEYALICACRVAVHLTKVVVGYLWQLLLIILRPIGRVIRTFFHDLIQPFVQIAIDIGALSKPMAANADEQRVGKSRLYLRLFWDAFSFLLPVAALFVFVTVVRNGTQLHFVLDVQVDGQSVGYVQSEQVFETARADVQSRLNNARAAVEATGNTLEEGEWEISPTYTLTIGTETMNESEMANAIMRVSSDEIGEGTAVYVDGVLQFVTTDGDHLRAYLQNMKAPYEDALDINTHVSFLHDIELEDGVYMLSSLEEYPDVIAAFNENPEIHYYTAGSNETAGSAAANSGVDWDSLAQMNPSLLSLDQPIAEGTQLVTGASSPEWLKVKMVRRQSYIEDIPFETEYRNSNKYDYGTTHVEQEGQVGQQEVTQDITYIDGVIASTELVSVEMLSQPVNKVVLRGTHIASGLEANIGSGSFIWPVPGYTYVSRWVGGASNHRGADICAPNGTPIYASDSGVVTVSTNGAGTTYWSYGNYVKIDHGNGWQTLYAHMSSRAVEAGQAVEKGQLIGYVGDSGNARGYHCHFEMLNNGSLYNARNLWPNM